MFRRNTQSSNPGRKSNALNSELPWRTSRPFHTFTTITPEDAPIRLGLNLVVPSFGVTIIQPTEAARIEAQARNQEPEYDHVLGGSLEITLPLSINKLRYKSIKIGIKVNARLFLGPGREQEDDELFRRESEVGDGSIDTILTGNTKVDFTFVLPSWLPIQDYHRPSTVLCTLYAIIEGFPVIDSGSSSVDKSRSNSGDTDSASTASRSLSAFGRVTTTLASLTLRPAASTSKTSLDSSLSPASSRSINVDADGVASLIGQQVAERAIRIFHNPDPAGGPNTLKEELRKHVDGLGDYIMALFSDIWTISSILKATMAITEVLPTTTIFHIEVFIRQNHRITSPRDGKEVNDSKRFSILSDGFRPAPRDLFPSRKAPALWRGVAAGGTDKDVFVVEKTGRLPTDSYLRPTTMPGVLTPLNVSHQLEVDVRFSVHGENAAGKRLALPGPGELRVLQISRKTVMPACTLMPDVLQLPLYDDAEQDLRLGERSHDPRQPWDACACFLTDAEVEERLRRAAKAEEVEQERRDEAVAQKETAAFPHGMA